MFIQEVLSYKNSWDKCASNYHNELQEVLETLSDYTSGKIVVDSDESRFPRKIWEVGLQHRGWETLERNQHCADGKRIHVGFLGPVKNGLSAQLHMGFPNESLARWLFQQAAIAMKYKLISMPILLAPVREFAKRLDGNRMMSRNPFEMLQDQVQMLSPLTYLYPFLIVGYSDEPTLMGPNIIEIEEDTNADGLNQVVNRCIEFPPEYHQAGLGILNFFASYLREQYPNEEAAVKIEQHGLLVRLIITTESGQTETIEKALQEYELIISGEKAPEELATNATLVLELKNELRIAKFRIESQQDIISLQNTRMDKLLNIIGDGLKQPISIDFKPTVIATSNVQLNPRIAMALGGIAELKEILPHSSDAYLALGEVEASLERIEKEKDPEIVKRSPAMNKFRRILDNFAEKDSSLRKAIDTAESGWDLFKDLAGKYNKIAEWCGLPQVPFHRKGLRNSNSRQDRPCRSAWRWLFNKQIQTR